MKYLENIKISANTKCISKFKMLFSNVAELWSYSLSHFSPAICFFPANETFTKR